MQLTSLPQYVNNAKRFREIVHTLTKYGLAGWIADSRPDFVQNLRRGGEGQQLSGLSTTERIRLALTELGPTFIKLVQMLNTREDLIGVELADELARLQSDTPADSADTVRKTIIDELGKPPEELFAEFDGDAPPRDLGHILNRAKRGTFEVQLEHQRLETMVNRLVPGILTAALTVASALLWSAAAPPLVAGISLFGAAGYALAAFLGYQLIVAIIKLESTRQQD